jgi:hypothetical protein
MHSTFDYIIVGAGAAGLQLALVMADDAFFFNKKIAIIDKKKTIQMTTLVFLGATKASG